MTEILFLIRRCMKIYPELRFGQLISNAAFKGGWKDNDMFYCPDKIIADGLLKLLLQEEEKQDAKTD